MITKLYYCRSCGSVSVEHLDQSDLDNEFFSVETCKNLTMETGILYCGGNRQEFDIKKLIGDIFK